MRFLHRIICLFLRHVFNGPTLRLIGKRGHSRRARFCSRCYGWISGGEG